jgi:hypothetical protein
MDNSSDKQVRAVVRCMPNYILHVMAVARINFDSEYASRYADTLETADLDTLEKHRDLLLTFGRGKHESIADVIIGFPIAFRLDDLTSLEEYFSVLISGLEKSDMTDFSRRFDQGLSDFHRWLPFDVNDLVWFVRHLDAIRETAGVILHNFSQYEESIWPEERQELEAVAGRVNKALGKRDYIGEWETITDLRFKSDHYDILLCSAIEGGPNANSIGYDQVIFFHRTPFDKLIQFISHEIGTHLLIDIYSDLTSTGQFDRATVFAAYECLAKHYNSRILAGKDLVYELTGLPEEKYLPVYAQLQGANPNIKAPELLRVALESIGSAEEQPRGRK